MIDMEKLIKILEQYPLIYTIERNNIPLEISPIKITIERYMTYDDMINLLTQLKEEGSTFLQINCEVRP